MEKEFGDQNLKESHQFGNLRSADGDVASSSLISLNQLVGLSKGKVRSTTSARNNTSVLPSYFFLFRSGYPGIKP